MLIKFSDQDLSICEDFAQNMDTSYYASRKQFNPEKRQKDQIIGKLGELATFYYLENKNIKVSYPDFKIYKKKEKSWDFDLKGENINLHVKSQAVEQAQKYGISFIFQYGNGSNRAYDKEIFDRASPNQYVSFVVVNLKERHADIKCIIDLNLLHEKELFKLPRLKFLQENNKKAVYFADLEKCDTNQLWKF